MDNLVIVPCFKRPEYTEKCIKSLEKSQDYQDTTFYLVDDGSNDETEKILRSSNLPSHVIVNRENVGLRQVLIDFFEFSRPFKYVMKVDNDCEVPKSWLDDMKQMMFETDADILSPNVFPSDAANKFGSPKFGLKYIPSKIVGGLWCMRTSLYKDIKFEPVNTFGIKGAFNLLNQIIVETDAKVGWVPSVVFQDLGHYSGKHPDHIKSEEHLNYSIEVGRPVSWA